MKPWEFHQTIGGLRYIAATPRPTTGGFHPTTCKIAESALHHIARLKRQIKVMKDERGAG